MNTSTGLPAVKVAPMAALFVRVVHSVVLNVSFAKPACTSMMTMIALLVSQTAPHVLQQNALSVPMGTNHLTQEIHAHLSTAKTDITLIVLITDVTTVPPPITALYVLTPLLAMNVKMAIIWTLLQKHANHVMLPAKPALENWKINAPNHALSADSGLTMKKQLLLKMMGHAANALLVAIRAVLLMLMIVLIYKLVMRRGTRLHSLIAPIAIILSYQPAVLAVISAHANSATLPA